MDTVAFHVGMMDAAHFLPHSSSLSLGYAFHSAHCIWISGDHCILGQALFRDVAMMVPDYAMIAEIMLYSYGYLEARSMALQAGADLQVCPHTPSCHHSAGCLQTGKCCILCLCLPCPRNGRAMMR